MTDDSSVRLQLDLADEPTTGQLVVDLDAFNTFSRWIDEDLQRLVDRWSSHAAPVTNRQFKRSP